MTEYEELVEIRKKSKRNKGRKKRDKAAGKRKRKKDKVLVSNIFLGATKASLVEVNPAFVATTPPPHVASGETAVVHSQSARPPPQPITTGATAEVHSQSAHSNLRAEVHSQSAHSNLRAHASEEDASEEDGLFR